jgi:hypothetical protein
MAPYTWLATSTRYSSVLASIFHGSSNWFANRMRTFLVSGSLLTFGVAMGLGWLIIVLIVYGILKRSPVLDVEQPMQPA